jgi:hypothetical protein
MVFSAVPVQTGSPPQFEVLWGIKAEFTEAMRPRMPTTNPPFHPQQQSTADAVGRAAFGADPPQLGPSL